MEQGLQIALHLDGSNTDVSLHMEGSHADFAPHMEWIHSFRDQKIANISILVIFFIHLLKPPMS